MRTAENIQAHASSGNNAKNAFFSKGGVRTNVHSAIQTKPTPFFNTTQNLQTQGETNGLNSSNETIATEEPKVFTKPKSFWVMENDKASQRYRAFYSAETVTMEQLTHSIFKNPVAMLDTFSNMNGKTATQEIPAYSRIKIPATTASVTGWAIKGLNASLIFNGVSRNPFPILAAMGVSSSGEFTSKKKLITQQLEVEKPIMAMNIRFGMEGDFIKTLKKYAQLNFTEYPDKYTGGGQYIDKVFVYLRRDVRKIGYFDQVTSSYDLIFNHFKRADEVKQIRDGYSRWFKGDSGIREITYSDVFIEEAFLKALNAAGVPKAKIMNFLNKAGNTIADIISNPKKFLHNLIGAVKSGFSQFVGELPSLLGSGLLELVTGKIGVGNVALPKDFSPKSMLEFSLNTLNLDMQRIVTEVVGAENKERIDKVWGVLQTLMQKGVGGLANQLIEYVVDIKTVFVDKLKNWVIKDLIKSAISKLLKVLVPGGGLIEVIEKVYDVIQFVREKLAALKALFVTVGQSVLQIVNGDIEGAASKINGVLKNGLELLLDLFARLMKINFLDGIKEAIQNLREKIVGGIKKLIEKIVVGGNSNDENTSSEEGDGELGKEVRFSDGEENHKLWVNQDDKESELMVASTPMTVEKRLTIWEADLKKPKWTHKGKAEKKTRIAALLVSAKSKLATIDTSIDKVSAASSDQATQVNTLDNQIEQNEVFLAETLKKLFIEFAKKYDFKVLYAENLMKTHKYSKTSVDASVDKISKEMTDKSTIKSWNGLVNLLKVTPDAKRIFDNPLKNNDSYGQFAKNQVVMAGQSELNDKYTVEKGTEITDSIAESPRCDAFIALRNQILDKGSESSVFGILKKAFKSDSDHNRFYPVEIRKSSDGRLLTYKYAGGNQEFTVDLTSRGYPERVIGDNLSLHDLGRGTTQDPQGKIRNAGMDSAHIIANMFGGSGYSKAKNIVATSAEYNRQVMAPKEREIAGFVQNDPDATEFSLDLTVKYANPNHSVVLSDVKKAIIRYTEEDDKRRVLNDEKLEEEIEGRLKQTLQPRLLTVIYEVHLFENNVWFLHSTFKLTEADLLFGTR